MPTNNEQDIKRALAIHAEIKELLLKRGVWFKEDFDYKPELKATRIELSVKVGA